MGLIYAEKTKEKLRNEKRIEQDFDVYRFYRNGGRSDYLRRFE